MEATVNQTVKDNETRVSPNMVAVARAAAKAKIAAEALAAFNKEAAQADISKDATPEAIPTVPTAVKPTAKASKGKHESMEALALRLRKAKANEATILKAFTVAYKAKGQTDVKFIKPRVAIYLKIADNAITASKAKSKVS